MARNLILIIVLLLATVLAACAPQAVSLDNTSWKLVKLGEKSVPAKIEITADFHGKQITGKSACNSYFAGYTQANYKLTLTAAGSTMMACMDNDIMQWETDYLNALGNVKGFQMANGQLELLDSGGKTIMTFGK